MRILIGFCLCFTLSANAAEIYRCRMAQGGEFWSSGPCRNSGGYMVDAVQVPGNMNFQEQVRFAEGRANSQSAARASEDRDIARRSECLSIEAELKQLASRYDTGQYQPPERVIADRSRTHELNAKRQQFQCQTR
jgi:hypothetical protein